MIIQNLDFPRFHTLLRSVFGLAAKEKDCTIFIDLPDEKLPDSLAWMDRRRIATQWYAMLREHVEGLPFTAVRYCAYDNVGTNNGDLPFSVMLLDTASRSGRESEGVRPLSGILESAGVVLALTELSATAPLKLLARQYGFRGATLPGFTRAMIPALGLDYEAVNARVQQVKERMDRAQSADIRLMADGKEYDLHIDLRFRPGHASGGILREKGTVGNLPSGEAYIVPYEGEKPGIESQTEGTLPVQFGDEVVLFRVTGNRAVEVRTAGKKSDEQRARLDAEPAYGNIAELGIGVLGEWGVQGVGSTLLDEKLGLHIAFGRSDHFGGATPPASFRDPARVIHIDWVYVPSVQPRIAAGEVAFTYDDGKREVLLRDGALRI
jgi:hypothetical protein